MHEADLDYPPRNMQRAYEGLIMQFGDRLAPLKGAADAMDIVANEAVDEEKLAVFARGIAALHSDLDLTYKALLGLSGIHQACEEDQKKPKLMEA
jgi:hypothetical protein